MPLLFESLGAVAKQHNLDIEASMVLSPIPRKHLTAHAVLNRSTDHLKSDDAYRKRANAPDHAMTAIQFEEVAHTQDQKV
ncbi:hypothetical protein B4129_0338 [Bacillus safensis]|nr:hypothetical protein B4129_0338 [Bacillus safensis]